MSNAMNTTFTMLQREDVAPNEEVMKRDELNYTTYMNMVVERECNRDRCDSNNMLSWIRTLGCFPVSCIMCCNCCGAFPPLCLLKEDKEDFDRLEPVSKCIYSCTDGLIGCVLAKTFCGCCCGCCGPMSFLQLLIQK